MSGDEVTTGVDAYLPPDPSRHLLRRLAAGLLDHYRTMDPVIAQFWASPGIAPVSPDEPADVPRTPDPCGPGQPVRRPGRA